jgi:hypothetical protein
MTWTPRGETDEEFWAGAATRPLDLQRLIDYADELSAPGGKLAGVIDMDRIAVTGGSSGGWTALEGGGAQMDLSWCANSDLVAQLPESNCPQFVPHQQEIAAMLGLSSAPTGLWPPTNDPRVDAVIALAPDGDIWGADYRGVSSVKVPTLIIAGSEDSTNLPELCAYPIYEHLGSTDKALAILDGADHDLAWYKYSDSVEHLMTAFLLAKLKGDSEAANALLPVNVNFPGVKYESSTTYVQTEPVSSSPTEAPPVTPLPESGSMANQLDTVWGSSGTDIFAAGVGGRILHYDGSSWSPMGSTTVQELACLWGSSGKDVFAVGFSGTLLHYDGNAWSPMDSGTHDHLIGVWGSSSSDVFAVGLSGTVLHYDGQSWSPMDSGTRSHLIAVWGSSGSDVFAVGMSGTVLHYDGQSWSPMDRGSYAFLFGVWGSSGNDVFAAGESGTILHYDGSTWSPMQIDTSQEMIWVWGSSANDVFAVGAHGTILHYNGSAWSAMPSNSISDLQSVWGSSGSDVFAVGTGKTILHYDGTAWMAVDNGVN